MLVMNDLLLFGSTQPYWARQMGAYLVNTGFDRHNTAAPLVAAHSVTAVSLSPCPSPVVRVVWLTVTKYDIVKHRIYITPSSSKLLWLLFQQHVTAPVSAASNSL